MTDPITGNRFVLLDFFTFSCYPVTICKTFLEAASKSNMPRRKTRNIEKMMWSEEVICSVIHEAYNMTRS